jgi:hypothetical protein
MEKLSSTVRLVILAVAVVAAAVSYVALKAYHQMHTVLPLYVINRS